MRGRESVGNLPKRRRDVEIACSSWGMRELESCDGCRAFQFVRASCSTTRSSMLSRLDDGSSRDVAVTVVKSRISLSCSVVPWPSLTASPQHPSTPASASPVRLPPVHHNAPPCSPPSPSAPLSTDSIATRRALAGGALVRGGSEDLTRVDRRRGHLQGKG
jgi:hypothetical protein